MSNFSKAYDELFLLNKGRGPDKSPRRRKTSVRTYDNPEDAEQRKYAESFASKQPKRRKKGRAGIDYSIYD